MDDCFNAGPAKGYALVSENHTEKSTFAKLKNNAQPTGKREPAFFYERAERGS